ncbi:MAG: ABC transporter substrate-binding protein [Dehalococcoidia bacterium]
MVDRRIAAGIIVVFAVGLSVPGFLKQPSNGFSVVSGAMGYRSTVSGLPSLVRLLIPVICLVWMIACSGDVEEPTSQPAAPGSSPTASATPSDATGTPVPGPASGGSLRIAQQSDPASCDLHMSRALSYQAVHPCNPMLSQLVRVSPGDHGVIEPDLSLSWGTSPDGTEWTFDLRDDALWHDGSQVTADDVLFSLSRIIDPPTELAVGRAGAVARYVGTTEQVTAPDSSTVVIRTDFPAASFLSNLASVYVSMYPRHATEVLDPPSMVQFESVVGSGPFTPGPVVRGSSFSLLRNNSYYEPDLPHLDEVQFVIMPEPAIRLAALRSHDVDTIAVITEPEAQSLERDFSGRITVFNTPSAGGNTVQLNLHEPPFDDPAVRRAVNLAISRPEANAVLGDGYIGAILPPGGQWALPEAEVFELPGYGDKEIERAEARQLLTEAGLEDGLDVDIHTRANPFFETLSEFVAGQLSTVGIRATVVPVEPVAYQDMLARGDFQVIGHSHSFALDDPDSILPDHYACGGAENFPGLCDSELDELISQQSRTLDPGERRALLDDIQRRIWDTDAKVWFQWSTRRTPVWANVHGLEPGGPSIYQGRRLEQVWIEQ